MKTYNAATLTSFRSGSFAIRRLFKFEWSQTYAFWDGDAPFTPTGSAVASGASGVTFQAGGSFFELDLQEVGIDGAAPQFSLRLRSQPNSRLSPDVLGTIRQQTYHRKRVSIFLGNININTRAVNQVLLVCRGYIDKIDHLTNYNEDGSVTEMLQASGENSIVEWKRQGAHDRNDESQKDTFPGDKGLRHLENHSMVYQWGKGVKS